MSSILGIISLLAKKSVGLGWDPTHKSSSITLSSGNHVATTSVSNNSVLATMPYSGSGTRQFEVTIGGTVTSSGVFVGVDIPANVGNPPGTSGGAGFGVWSFNGKGFFNDTGDATGSFGAYAEGDVVGVTLSASGTLSFYKNGTAGYVFSGIDSVGALTTNFPSFGCTGNSGSPVSAAINLGNTTFAYPISGATTWI